MIKMNDYRLQYNNTQIPITNLVSGLHAGNRINRLTGGVVELMDISDFPARILLRWEQFRK